MKFQLFKKDGLAIHFYYSEESVVDNVVSVDSAYLIVPGLPQFTTKEYFETVITKDIAIFYVYYYGSWYSDGEFTMPNCRKSLTDAIDLIKGKTETALYDNSTITWKYNQLHVVGTSFGGLQILTTPILADDITLLAPFSYSKKEDLIPHMSEQQVELFQSALQTSLEFYRKGYINLYRGIENDSWKAALQSAPSDLISLSDKPPITIYHDPNDSVVPFASSQALAVNFPDTIEVKEMIGPGHIFTSLFTEFLKQ